MLEKEFLNLDKKEIVNALVNASKFVSTDPKRPQFLHMVHVLTTKQEGDDFTALNIQAADAYTAYIEEVNGFNEDLRINELVSVDDIQKLKEGKIENLPSIKNENDLINLNQVRPQSENVSILFAKSEVLPLLKGLKTVNNYVSKRKNNFDALTRNIVDINIKESENKNKIGSYDTILKFTAHYTGVSFELKLDSTKKMQDVDNNNFIISCDLRRLITALTFFEKDDPIIFNASNNRLKTFELTNGTKYLVIAPIRVDYTNADTVAAKQN